MLAEPLAEGAAEGTECLGLSDFDNGHTVESVLL